MKFKPVQQDSSDVTPNTNPKKLERNKTLMERSEHDSLTEEDESKSSSENLSDPKSPGAYMK